MTWITELEACRAAGEEVAPGQCPGCGLAGTTPERAWRVDPEYMRELSELPPHGIPETPRELCADCRSLWHYGRGPIARRLRRVFSGR